MTTALKQTKIATISTGIMGSPRAQKAMIETQKGLVCQHTKMRETGASGAAMLRSRKLI